MGVYRDMARKVHPDLNPNISDATAKMQQVNQYKDDPEMLLKLAKEWGLGLDGTFDDKKFDEKAEAFKERVYEAVVGAVVRHYYTYRRKTRHVRGVIIRVREIKKGKFAGAKEYSVYNFLDGDIIKFKSAEDNPFMRVVGMAADADLRMGIQTEQEIKARKKAKDLLARQEADNLFRDHGLVKNKNYEGSGISILYRTRWGNMFVDELVRTTAKSVYVKDGGVVRRIDIKKVVEVRRPE